MAYTDQYTLSKDATFLNRVEAALVANAKYIAAQPTETTARKALAYLILNSSRTYAVIFTSGIATDPTIASTAGSPPAQGNVTDAQIDATIAAVYNSYLQP